MLISVHDKDKPEVISLAKKFADVGLKIYSTPNTGRLIQSAGIKAEIIEEFSDGKHVIEMLETGKIDYIVYTGSTAKSTI